MTARQFGFSLIGLATCLGLLLNTMACTQAEPAIPQPSREIARFKVGDAWNGTISIVEFRDSAGRICVLAKHEGIALSCAAPLPPLKYEDLPEVP